MSNDGTHLKRQRLWISSMLARAWQAGQEAGSSMRPRSMSTSTEWLHTKQRKNA